MSEFESASHVLSRMRSNEYYRRALETEEFRDAANLRDRAIAVRRAIPGVPELTTPVAAADLTEEWLNSAADHAEASRRNDARLAALAHVIDQCDRFIESAAANLEPALAALGGEMRDLMAHVGAVVQRLNGATTPSAVIAAGVGEVWRELSPLRDAYDRIRTAQDWLMVDRLEYRRTGPHDDDPHASAAWLRNLDGVFPGWRSRDTTVYVNHAAPDRRPWPHDPIEQLVWLSNSGAQPWVPTLSELTRLQASRPPQPTQPRSREERSKRARLESHGMLGG